MNRFTREERRIIRRDITRERVETLVPKLMAEHGIDFWVVFGGDGVVEPVLESLLEEPALNRTFLIFANVNGEFAKYQSYRFSTKGDGLLYTPFLEQNENVFTGIKRLLEKHKPSHIAINTSDTFTSIDCATVTLQRRLQEVCGDLPIISAEPLALDYMQIRLPKELEYYNYAAEAAQTLIRETLCSDRITPGVTTVADLHYYMVERMDAAGLPHTWGPNVDLQRQGSDNPMIGTLDDKEIIMPGDLVHIDFGFIYLQLDTDMQYLLYVCKEGETEPPKGLVDGFAQCCAHQQIYIDCIASGKLGNEVRREITERAKAEGMEAMVYSHPIGRFVHAVGPCIGKFGIDGDLPHGEYVIKDNTCYALEQNVRVAVPEWDNQKVFIFREEDIAMIDGKAKKLGTFQTELWYI